MDHDKTDSPKEPGPRMARHGSDPAPDQPDLPPQEPVRDAAQDPAQAPAQDPATVDLDPATSAPDEDDEGRLPEISESELDREPARVPYHDIWIAALALQHGLEVVSRDGHFDKMPAVRRLAW